MLSLIRPHSRWLGAPSAALDRIPHRCRLGDCCWAFCICAGRAIDLMVRSTDGVVDSDDGYRGYKQECHQAGASCRVLGKPLMMTASLTDPEIRTQAWPGQRRASAYQKPISPRCRL